MVLPETECLLVSYFGFYCYDRTLGEQRIYSSLQVTVHGWENPEQEPKVGAWRQESKQRTFLPGLPPARALCALAFLGSPGNMSPDVNQLSA